MEFIINLTIKSTLIILLLSLLLRTLKNNAAALRHWEQGKSQFKIWTYGDFKTYNASPYIEVNSPDGMVILEEERKSLFGTKKYQLVITKAPFDGALVQT